MVALSILCFGAMPIKMFQLLALVSLRMQFGLLASILWSALAVESEYHVGFRARIIARQVVRIRS